MKYTFAEDVPVICFREKVGNSSSWQPVHIFQIKDSGPFNPVVTAWDNDTQGGIDNAAIAWAGPSYIKKIDGVWEPKYFIGKDGANPFLTSSFNVPYFGYTESNSSPYRINVEPIISGLKDSLKTTLPHERMLSLELKGIPGMEFKLSIEVGDLIYNSEANTQIITPKYSDSLITPANAFEYQSFMVNSGRSMVKIPITIFLSAGKTLPEFKGDFINFKIYDGKKQELQKQILSLKQVLNSSKADGFFTDTLSFDLSAYAGNEICAAGSSIMELFNKWITIAEVYDLRDLDGLNKGTNSKVVTKTSGTENDKETSEVGTVKKFELYNNYPNPF
ncbi:MAG: hypothetical protein KAR38_04910, partial [Calditrichia bacterium]|nr:hypothetical protein [Calditrichia bacterium]